MADHTYIDPEGTKAAGSRLRAKGARFKAAADKIVQATQQYDGCWGNDEFGQKFGEGYKPGSDSMVTGVGGLADGVVTTVDGVELSVDALVKTDENNAKGL